MAAIQDHEYIKICAKLARCLNISLASARKNVDLVASKQGVRDLATRKTIAQRLLDQAEARLQSKEDSPALQLDRLLEALAEEDNFMLED